MSGLPIEAYVILSGIGVVVLAVLLLRFGRLIARALLIAGGLTLAVIVGLAVLNLAEANTEMAQAAQVASAGQTATTAGAMLCIGGLGALALVGVGAASVFYVRWQLSERQQPRLQDNARHLLNYQQRRDWRQPQTPPIVLVAGGEDGDRDVWGEWEW